MKWLIVTADDFGMTHGINRGILLAHRSGILTSTSLMVDRTAAPEAAALARAYPTLSVGLHLELDDVEPERVPAELDRQLERFLELLEASPTHADSHHDAHHDPRVLPCVLDWARRAGLWLRGHSAIRHMSKFYGQWGGESHPEQIGIHGLTRLLDREIRGEVTELNCHPGFVDQGIPSSYAAERELELRTLCDPRSRQAIRERDIELIGFRDLPPLVPSISPAVASRAT